MIIEPSLLFLVSLEQVLRLVLAATEISLIERN
ncbi:BnaC08g40110D [Brassica napus]|uniref:BnaC08g40110D protein n=1 Tax=Brassica napus TaxID=3708 RepID=A0A078FTG0_BRANA|nr:BnaC08g40110D [Brassica napus]